MPGLRTRLSTAVLLGMNTDSASQPPASVLQVCYYCSIFYFSHFHNNNSSSSSNNNNNQDNVYGADVMIQSHCESSLGSRGECRTAPDGCRPLDQADGLEALTRL